MPANTKRKSDLDELLDEELKDPAFAQGFDDALKAWDAALQAEKEKHTE